MKTIDQTPFYKENGELGMVDRAKAVIRFGAGWFKEVEAQRSVIAVFDRNLDKKYTLLHNVTPPGLNIMFPLILVGPTGLYVMTVTPLTGTVRAKADQWGTIVGDSLRTATPNMLTLTERMARAIQVFLKKQGIQEFLEAEAVLLCSDPSLHVDTMRPIVRVVMRDALDRFAASISQARVVLPPESVLKIVNCIITPLAPAQPDTAVPAEGSADTAAPEQAQDPYVPSFALPGAEFTPTPTQEATPWPFQPAEPFPPPARPPVRRRSGITRNQAILLIIMAVVWCLIVAVFAYLILKGI
ncbi:MAG: hypothetical protein WCE68_00750 [Anaerolineales bacterium]